MGQKGRFDFRFDNPFVSIFKSESRTDYSKYEKATLRPTTDSNLEYGTLTLTDGSEVLDPHKKLLDPGYSVPTSSHRSAFIVTIILLKPGVWS